MINSLFKIMFFILGFLIGMLNSKNSTYFVLGVIVGALLMILTDIERGKTND